MGSAHSSYLVWLVVKFRAIEKILPALKVQKKWGWVPAFLLVLVTLVAAVGIGIYIDGYAIHPPAQYTGVCPPPAQITKGSCFLITTSVQTVSGTVTTVTYTQPAGYIVTPNPANKTTTGGK